MANEELKARIDEIYQTVATGYRLHFVSSGAGLEEESRRKLGAFTQELQGPSDSYFQWIMEDLRFLQDMYSPLRTYLLSRNRISFSLTRPPYMIRSADHDCYFLHASGREPAAYAHHGEQLLPRDLRVDQGDTATNRSIRSTCTGDDSANFLHYNNGVAFLCDSAIWDGFLNTLTLRESLRL